MCRQSANSIFCVIPRPLKSNLLLQRCLTGGVGASPVPHDHQTSNEGGREGNYLVQALRGPSEGLQEGVSLCLISLSLCLCLSLSLSLSLHLPLSLTLVIATPPSSASDKGLVVVEILLGESPASLSSFM